MIRGDGGGILRSGSERMGKPSAMRHLESRWRFATLIALAGRGLCRSRRQPPGALVTGDRQPPGAVVTCCRQRRAEPGRPSVSLDPDALVRSACLPMQMQPPALAQPGPLPAGTYTTSNFYPGGRRSPSTTGGPATRTAPGVRPGRRRHPRGRRHDRVLARHEAGHLGRQTGPRGRQHARRLGPAIGCMVSASSRSREPSRRPSVRTSSLPS